MKVESIRIPYSYNEWHYLTVLSDLHIDAASFEKAKFKKLTSERNALPNHHYIGIGDMTNGIANGDRRYTPSVVNDKLAGVDAYANATVNMLTDVFKEYQVNFDVYGIGNHETAFMKYCNTDIASFICDNMGWAYGGYEGMVKYRMEHVNGGGIIDFVVMYHHGAWGGRLAKGFNGAQHYAFRKTGWDVFCYGHNHQMRHDVESIEYPTSTGTITEKKDVHLVCCGTHFGEQEEKKGSLPPYEKQKGYSPSSIGSPLIKWRVVNDSGVDRRRSQLPTRRIEVKIEL